MQDQSDDFIEQLRSADLPIFPNSFTAGSHMVSFRSTGGWLSWSCGAGGLPVHRLAAEAFHVTCCRHSNTVLKDVAAAAIISDLSICTGFREIHLSPRPPPGGRNDVKLRDPPTPSVRIDSSITGLAVYFCCALPHFRHMRNSNGFRIASSGEEERPQRLSVNNIRRALLALRRILWASAAAMT